MEMDWNTAKTACDKLILNGYNDWYLPTKDELNALYNNLKQLGIGGFEDDDYWSSTLYDLDLEVSISFRYSGGESHYPKSGDENVRAVRAF
jgi:hypothetical protein